MSDGEGAGDDFSGLTGQPRRGAAHAYLLVALIALIGTVTAIVVLVTASAFTDVLGSGHLICPDGQLPGWTTALLFVAFPIVFCLFALGSRSERPVSAEL
jgi:hypothetical protein